MRPRFNAYLGSFVLLLVVVNWVTTATSRQSGPAQASSFLNGEAKIADAATRRAAFLNLINRPRVPLAAETKELGESEGLSQLHISFAADAAQRVPGIVLKQTKSAGRHPVVVALHGTGGNKDGQLALLKELAGRGFIG